MNPQSADRIETELRRLADSVADLVVIKERLKQDWRRMEAIEARLEKVEDKAGKTDRKLTQWIDRGIGAWALFAALAAGFKYFPAAVLPPDAPRVQTQPAAATSTH